MRIYKLSSFTKTAWKFAVPASMTCGHCWSVLNVIDVVDNPNHHFNPGQLYSCTCRKSRMWTNSIRYPEDLIKYCDGEEVPHHHDPEVWGFCNDKYCPYCWHYIDCLKTGKEIHGMYYDIFGCGSCLPNRYIIHTGRNLGESEGQKYLAHWYKDNQAMWRDKIHE